MIRVEKSSGIGEPELVRTIDLEEGGTFPLGRGHVVLRLYRNHLLHVEALGTSPVLLRFPHTLNSRTEQLDRGHNWTNTSTDRLVIGPRRMWLWTERLIITGNPLSSR